ncbi:MAG: cytochrome c3 family protein [Raoultibacter sp.]
MSEENSKVEAATEETVATPMVDSEAAASEAAPKKKKKKWPIVVGIVAVVLVAAGAGFWVWHEQPSFCNAICHTPMDPYVENFEQQPGSAGLDKYGNEVSNVSAMLAVSHKVSAEEGGAGTDCLGCHVPTMGEQITEGMNWISGAYEYPLYERTGEDLVEARGLEADQFCLNEGCHNITRQDLIEKTSDMERNPHVAQHGEIACTECHKGHRASVNYCSQCHSDSEIPDGWLTTAQANKLEGVA